MAYVNNGPDAGAEMKAEMKAERKAFISQHRYSTHS